MEYKKPNKLNDDKGNIDLPSLPHTQDDMNPIQRKIDLLRCPSCKSSGITIDILLKGLKCNNCNETFNIMSENTAILLSNKGLSDKKIDIQAFWSDTCQQWYSSLDANLNAEILNNHLDDLEDMFVKRQHLAVTEMETDSIKGMNILEIGSGGGGHSALFKRHGADIVAVDITPERVRSTGKKLSLLGTESGVAFVADAENIPFNDNSFDIVYSNGVLHHSESTEKCVDEVYRVLKKSGRAIIMLYSRHSAGFWLRLFIKGVLSGDIFRFKEAEWLGRITEGRPKYGSTKNSFTRVYSKNEIKRLFCNFEIISLRKHSFDFGQSIIPFSGRLRKLLMNVLGYKDHPGGIIVYGSPYMVETKLESALGPYIGFDWNIVAAKRN